MTGLELAAVVAVMDVGLVCLAILIHQRAQLAHLTSMRLTTGEIGLYAKRVQDGYQELDAKIAQHEKRLNEQNDRLTAVDNRTRNTTR